MNKRGLERGAIDDAILLHFSTAAMLNSRDGEKTFHAVECERKIERERERNKLCMEFSECPMEAGISFAWRRAYDRDAGHLSSVFFFQSF